MSARILVVDDVPTNAKLLEARLTADYYDVLVAQDGVEALRIIHDEQPDIVLLDVMMPGMNGFEVCRRIKSNPKSQHIPVVMVTALDQAEDRIKGLEAGADDFLTKPVNDIALMARVKSLVRLKAITDELQMRSLTGVILGFESDDRCRSMQAECESGRILLVDDDSLSAETIYAGLKSRHRVDIEKNPQAALMRAAEDDYDLVVVSLSLENFDGLRLCSQIRSLDRTRHLPILIVVEPGDDGRIVRGLDLGVNDYIVRPVDENELIARTRTQLRRKRFAESLRQNLQDSMELAVTDGLTGLHNRRYMESHMKTLVEEAINRGKDLSMLIMDIDFFKSVNDTHGHDVGDEVLIEFSRRLGRGVRSFDLLCRFGGEEFVLVMPETDIYGGMQIGERLRQIVASQPFKVSAACGKLDITMSIGVGALRSSNDRSEDILKRADQALYRAKRDGRNRVVADAA